MVERIVTIPLKLDRTSRRKKARKAIRDIKNYVRKQTDEQIKIDQDLNDIIWKRGVQNPPSSIRVKIISRDGYVYVQPPEKEIKEDRFECEQCGKSFKTEQGLKMHIETSHAEEEEDEEEEIVEESEEDVEEVDESDESVDMEEALDGTISEGKEKIEDMDDPDLEALLAYEQNNKNRKGMIEFLESKMSE